MLGVLHDISRQRAAMAALRGSEERYRTMVESLNEGVMIFDAQARLKGVNPAAERLLGASFEQLRSNERGRLAADRRRRRRRLPPERCPIAVVLATGQSVRHALLGMRTPSGRRAGWTSTASRCATPRRAASRRAACR